MGNYRYIHPEKKRLILTMTAHASAKDIARQTEIGIRTIQHVKKNNRQLGDVVWKSAGNGRPRLLSPIQVFYAEALVKAKPDMLLKEVQAALYNEYKVEISVPTITRELKRRGLTRKKIARTAVEHSEEKRNEFQIHIGETCTPDMLVFVDESHCNRHTSNRQYGWAPTGDCARRRDFFVRGTRYSILPAISLDGVLHLDILTRSWAGDDFRSFINTLLDNMNPYPQRNSVVIMDNASTHHCEGLREMIEARGMRLVYLPPYSPDYNPIEEGFSAMKAWLREMRDYVLADMTDASGTDPWSILWDAVFSSMTIDNIAGWYRDSGYM